MLYFSPMTERVATRRIGLAAGITSLVGPAGAALYETRRLELFASDPFLQVWVLTTLAAFGVGIGVFSVCNGACQCRETAADQNLVSFLGVGVLV